MKPLAGRVAIVTGAGSGLGRSHARFLAQQGAKVAVNDVGGDAAAEVADEVRASGGDAIAAQGSVADEAAVTEVVRRTLTEWNRVDILVNNAGILRDRSFAKMTVDEFREVLDVHLMGASCSPRRSGTRCATRATAGS